MVVCLSIDVGIKNLAFCLLEKNTNVTTEESDCTKETKEKDIKKFRILQWSIVDLSQSEQVVNTCQFIEKEKEEKKVNKEKKVKKKLITNHHEIEDYSRQYR